jgi:hypothetical protein
MTYLRCHIFHSIVSRHIAELSSDGNRQGYTHHRGEAEGAGSETVTQEVRAGRMLPDQEPSAADNAVRNITSPLLNDGPNGDEDSIDDPDALLPAEAMALDEGFIEPLRSMSPNGAHMRSCRSPSHMLPGEAMEVDSLFPSGSSSSSTVLSDLGIDLAGGFRVGESSMIHESPSGRSREAPETWRKGTPYAVGAGEFLPVGETATLWSSACSKLSEGRSLSGNLPARSPQQPARPLKWDTCTAREPSVKVGSCGTASSSAEQACDAPGINSRKGRSSFYGDFFGPQRQGPVPAAQGRSPCWLPVEAVPTGFPPSGMNPNGTWTPQKTYPLIGESSILQHSRPTRRPNDGCSGAEVLRSGKQACLRGPWPGRDPQHMGPPHAGWQNFSKEDIKEDVAAQLRQWTLEEASRTRVAADIDQALSTLKAYTSGQILQEAARGKSAESGSQRQAHAEVRESVLSAASLCQSGVHFPKREHSSQRSEPTGSVPPRQRLIRQEPRDDAEATEHWLAVAQIQKKLWPQSDKFDEMLAEKGITVPPSLLSSWTRKSAKVAAIAEAVQGPSTRASGNAPSKETPLLLWERPPVGLQLLTPPRAMAGSLPSTAQTSTAVLEPQQTSAGTSKNAERVNAALLTPPRAMPGPLAGWISESGASGTIVGPTGRRSPGRFDPLAHLGVCETCGKCRAALLPVLSACQDASRSRRRYAEFGRSAESAGPPGTESGDLQKKASRQRLEVPEDPGKASGIPTWAWPQLPTPMYGEKTYSANKFSRGLEPPTNPVAVPVGRQPVKPVHLPAPSPVAYIPDSRKPPPGPNRACLPKPAWKLPEVFPSPSFPR